MGGDPVASGLLHFVRTRFLSGNRLYERMLDRSMTYTCGYWRNAADLDQAQHHKLDLICRKLDLKAGQRVLDIGCGWGSFAAHAAVALDNARRIEETRAALEELERTGRGVFAEKVLRGDESRAVEELLQRGKGARRRPMSTFTLDTATSRATPSPATSSRIR